MFAATGRSENSLEIENKAQQNMMANAMQRLFVWGSCVVSLKRNVLLNSVQNLSFRTFRERICGKCRRQRFRYLKKPNLVKQVSLNHRATNR